ncbi:hypothetical protein Q787_02150 [Ornithobacterium rhinotracheale H06-030791]|uniref:Uncharacterized protein n=1 Tax=Ornithobacterium rhinotracheale (strain ATCC 51463 / DSM 15997 / CCUG 23171 / CIP 104009 / LMG 9086) TaxID=867902 RepID=I3ZY45_ORNRL|nr:hypothetical protein Ornrh_0422 [Ornithobacterium rhinotracheale DSM 15997]AIQ00325.1 hypothetical protein Q785_02235 [Ornithobacterium rhinotracheale ORT-UMN 88]KGB67560.1 hypothetical protein Q787_02150 [Ornithobacterium rhinotracheale H06-030791]
MHKHHSTAVGSTVVFLNLKNENSLWEILYKQRDLNNG